MKVVLLTGHHPRHFYVADQISKIADNLLVVSCAMGLNPAVVGDHGDVKDDAISWFDDRYTTEKAYFQYDGFSPATGTVFPVGPKEINNYEVYKVTKNFNPDVIVVYGTSILKGEILNITPKIINFHLGMSPYYNGAGTNWWPMYNNEYEFVGTTVHYLDAGVDTGEIIGQCRAKIEIGDSPHDVGNKNIIAGCNLVSEILPVLKNNLIKPVKQWEIVGRPVYKMKEFTDSKVSELLKRIERGEIDQHVKNNNFGDYKMVDFNAGSPILVSSKDFLPK